MVSNDRLFLVYGNKKYYYSELLDDIFLCAEVPKIIFVNNNNPYSVFLYIIVSLLYKLNITLLDGDLSSKELDHLGINQKDLNETYKINEKINVEEISVFRNSLQDNKDGWEISLYTSGTTGTPKVVTHSYHGITKNVRAGVYHEEDVWGFAYNPTHMAGLQVFFQALMNINSLIYVFGEHQKNLSHFIKSYNITHISATPTYYRYTLPFIDEEHKSVKRLTTGGEKYDPDLISSIEKIFPNAKVTNIYASTEAGSIFISNGDTFMIPEDIRSYVKVIEGELFLHKKILGIKGDLIFVDDWYNTGDVVELVDNRLSFVARNTDLINVGGYNVNPYEVEAVIKSIPGVIDVRVWAKENKLIGNVIIADVVKSSWIGDVKDFKKTIKSKACEHLQEWKVPRIINLVEEVKVTSTGKKVRK